MTKIAIVEDEAAIRQMYAMKLKFAGYSVVEAVDGEQGLQIIEREKPDIILLDLRMPKMAGDEMLRELRNQEWGKDVPVIVLTNISRDEAPRTLWHLGIDGFIIKADSTPKRVVEQIEDVLSERNAL